MSTIVELQLLNRVLRDGNDDILIKNNITEEYFSTYKDEYDYIMSHKREYGNIPDIDTFLVKFPEFDVIQVNESEEFLIKTFREEYLYSKTLPILTTVSNLIQTDTNRALEYLKAELPKLKLSDNKQGVNIIAEAKQRLQEWEETKSNPEAHFIPTGFEELDDIIGGFHSGEELAVLFARTGVGKSWVLIKMLEHAWKMNRRIGLIEPEMTANKTGYRFDTLHAHISNVDLTRGNDIRGYTKYIDKLSQSEVPFFVAHPKDFDRRVTVSKLRAWVESNNIDVLAVDGITYLRDERKDKFDNTTMQLTHISEDLMELSIEMNIPIIVVVQSNREGAKADDLGLENIRDSDGIAYNASLVIAIQQKESGLQLLVNKSRNSQARSKLLYMWDADLGKFDYIPTGDSEKDKEKAEDLRRRYSEDEDETY